MRTKPDQAAGRDAGRRAALPPVSRALTCACPFGSLKIVFDKGKIISVDLLGGAAMARASRGLDWTKLPDTGDSPRSGLPFPLNGILRKLKSYVLDKKHPGVPDGRFSFSGLTAFTRNVILGTRRVPMGRTVTYTEFARMLGLSPDARRAVGRALGRNPFPLFFPCHRIVGAKDAGGFSSGPDWKRRLLEHEGARAA